MIWVIFCRFGWIWGDFCGLFVHFGGFSLILVFFWAEFWWSLVDFNVPGNIFGLTSCICVCILVCPGIFLVLIEAFVFMFASPCILVYSARFVCVSGCLYLNPSYHVKFMYAFYCHFFSSQYFVIRGLSCLFLLCNASSGIMDTPSV